MFYAPFVEIDRPANITAFTVAMVMNVVRLFRSRRTDRQREESDWRNYSDKMSKKFNAMERNISDVRLGCSGFFKRSIHRHRHYICKAQGDLKDKCPVDKTHRNQCRSCRLARCFLVNMNKDGREGRCEGRAAGLFRSV